MKKVIIAILVFIFIFVVLFIIHKNTSILDPSTQDHKDKTIEEEPKTPYVSYNKWLHTDSSSLLNEKNEEIQLKGLSSHGIQWYSDVITYDNLKYLKDNWNINIFRIAMYTSEDGYINHPTEIKSKVYQIADMVIDLDMYVIIDWHILSDNDPNIYKEQSKAFFNETSQKYANVPNVIYEICNEPNANYVTWDNHVKPYAEEIIPIIRNNSPKSLVIVGTPDWCKNLRSPADSPLQFDNILYSCHFYSGTHKEELRDEIEYALNKEIPVIVSECGTSDASGNGEVYLDAFSEWIDFLDKNNISWINWSFSNKDESTAILRPDYPVQNNLDNNNNSTDVTLNTNTVNETETIDNQQVQANLDDYLTPSGEYIKKMLKLLK